jgi:transcriptional regulator with XRE-family HTH domain
MPYKITITDWDGNTIKELSFDSLKPLIASVKTDMPADWATLDGSQLKQLRKNWRMKQADLAKILGFRSKSMVSQLETGARRLTERTKRIIYKAFKVLEDKQIASQIRESRHDAVDNIVITQQEIEDKRNQLTEPSFARLIDGPTAED